MQGWAFCGLSEGHQRRHFSSMGSVSTACGPRSVSAERISSSSLNEHFPACLRQAALVFFWVMDKESETICLPGLSSSSCSVPSSLSAILHPNNRLPFSPRSLNKDYVLLSVSSVSLPSTPTRPFWSSSKADQDLPPLSASTDLGFSLLASSPDLRFASVDPVATSFSKACLTPPSSTPTTRSPSLLAGRRPLRPQAAAASPSPQLAQPSTLLLPTWPSTSPRRTTRCGPPSPSLHPTTTVPWA